MKLTKDKLCHVAISSKNFSELFNLLSLIVSNDERNKLIKEAKEMFQKKFILEEWKKEHADALNAIAAHDAEVYYKDVGHEEGRAEGRAEGRQQTILETITSMLKKKCSFDFISEITGKSISEIKEIEKTMM